MVGRNIYYYQAFCYDEARNYGPSDAGARDLATNYWLGDVSDGWGTWGGDGLVDVQERDRALRWVDGLEAKGGTNINRALLEALVQAELACQVAVAHPGCRAVAQRPVVGAQRGDLGGQATVFL